MEKSHPLWAINHRWTFIFIILSHSCQYIQRYKLFYIYFFKFIRILHKTFIHCTLYQCTNHCFFFFFITCFIAHCPFITATPPPSPLPAAMNSCSVSRPINLYTSFITINIAHCSHCKCVYCRHSHIDHLFNVFSDTVPLFIVRSDCIVSKSNTYLMITAWCASEWREIGTEWHAGKSDPNISKVQT